MKLIVLFKRFCYFLIRVYNLIQTKNDKSIFIVPHHNCKSDKYDIINYRSDNALCLFNYMIRDEAFDEFCITIVVDNVELNEMYREYVKKINSQINVEFVPRNKTNLKYVKHFCHSKFVFSTTEYELFPYKIKKQCISCLGYFTPFKNDFIYKTEKEFECILKRNNNTYDYYFTTSPIASRVIASDTGVYYSKFKHLGFSRNDIFFSSELKTKAAEQISKDFPGFGKIIVYTPTFRDYESNILNKKRGLFGFDDKNIDFLIRILKKHNIVLITKLHPFQNKNVVEAFNSPNIRLYDSEQSNYSLYDLLSVADLLLTDYTSTVFDFLNADKPIIYNFYDKFEYEQSRGFAIEPIEAICPGHIVDNIDSLSNMIDYIFCGNDDLKEKRNEVSNFINYYQDGQSSKRICDFLF